MEIGPYRPTSNGTLEINPFSWHDYAHVLFGKLRALSNHILLTIY
jgi:hypothetical protein